MWRHSVKHVMLLLCALFFLTAKAGADPSLHKLNITEQERKRMSGFITVFTEMEFYGRHFTFDAEKAKPEQLIYFGIMHNILHNYGTIVTLKADGHTNCIDKKHVEETIKRYFGITFTGHATVDEFTFDGTEYTYYGGEGPHPLRADVREVFQKGEDFVMHGLLRDTHDGDKAVGTFIAHVSPWQHIGKNTWRLKTIDTELNKDFLPYYGKMPSAQVRAVG